MPIGPLMATVRFLRIVCVCLLTAVCSGRMCAQGHEMVNISYDPAEDSLFFAAMQQRMAEIRKVRPTVALVLSGGGAKGISHVGVLKYLEERGIPVDFVAGTSMGGLVGGFYSLGYSALEIDSMVRAIDWQVMMSDNVPLEYYSYRRKSYKERYVMDIPFTGADFIPSLPSGVKSGLNVYNLLSAVSVGYQHKMNFIDLPTPFCCVATEIVTQKEKHCVSGELIEALRSTMSIPGYFKPVRVDSLILSDGGTKNNFPTDIAKAVGADIIIGVRLSHPNDYTRMNNIADVLKQTTIYSGSMEANNRNVRNCSVYITPDISGFGMLSFGTDEADVLIGRGYAEAAKHEREFDSIVALVGDGGRELHNSKAVNTSNHKVKVTAVAFEGVSEQERHYLDNLVDLAVGEYYDREVFETSQAVVYGTMAFSSVTYRLVDDCGEGYRLIFRCHKQPVNSFGLGVRADLEEWFAALVNFGFGGNRLYGSSVDVTVRLSNSPYVLLDYAWQPLRGPKMGVSLKSQFQRILGTNGEDFDFKYFKQFWRNEARVFVSSAHWNQSCLQSGFRVEQLPFYREYGQVPDSIVRPAWDWWAGSPYLYLRFVYDNKNAHYFPDRGVRITAAYDYDFRKSHFVASSIQGIIPLGTLFAVQASLNGRYILGDANSNEYMNNYVGGTMAGRYYEQQIPFVGFNGEKVCDDILTTADMELRFRVARKCYLSLIGAAMLDGDSFATLDVQHAIFAAAVQFGYKAKLGPLVCNIHWNSLNYRFGAFFGAGYNF